jgi:hypothetical protein
MNVILYEYKGTLATKDKLISYRKMYNLFSSSSGEYHRSPFILTVFGLSCGILFFQPSFLNHLCLYRVIYRYIGHCYVDRGRGEETES